MRNLHRIVLSALTAAMVFTLAGWIPAEEDRDRDRDRDAPRAERETPRKPADSPPVERRDRGEDRDRPQRRVRPPTDEDAEGTEEGMPEARIAPGLPPDGRQVVPRIRVQRWRLGVYAVNTETGVRITRTIPNTPAWQAGLERRDRLVTVDGYQIGYVNGRLYPLGDELQRRADRTGRVTLLVQDSRTGDLVNMEVQLERYRGSPWPLP